MSFESLKLDPAILKAIADSGYTTPTPVQAQAIPAALLGSDLLASAQTGTGKTAAFMLPALQRLSKPATIAGCKGPRVLVLTPTRELAIQVTDAARTYGHYLKRVSVVSVVGGLPYFRQRQAMAGFVDIMVATPGRLMDYMEQGEIDFRRVEVLVLDEADRMLDMGFRDAVQHIVNALPKERQTLLFSATIDRSIADLAARLQKNPVRIEISSPQAKHDNIDQKVHFVSDPSSKRKLLSKILAMEGVDQAIVFAGTKHGADKLCEALAREGFKTAALHGNMRQNARIRTIDRMHEGKVQFLIATDVAARGIDVPGITHIINYDLPRVIEDYVHRIGRTGRAGKKGSAISLVYPNERGQLRRIEKFVGHPIEAMVVPGFEVTMGRSEFNSDRGGDRPRGGDRRSGFSRGGNRGGGRFASRGGSSDRGPRQDRGGFAPRGENRGERSFSNDRPASEPNGNVAPRAPREPGSRDSGFGRDRGGYRGNNRRSDSAPRQGFSRDGGAPRGNGGAPFGNRSEGNRSGGNSNRPSRPPRRGGRFSSDSQRGQSSW